MKDKTYQAIVNAFDLLATARPARTNGKVTAVNLAKEAGVSKATLYRYFDEYAELRDSYEAMRKNGIVVSEDVPETIQQACLLLKEEVKRLRSELAELKRKAAQDKKLHAHQVLLLWKENERLQDVIGRLQSQGNLKDKVVSLSSAAASSRSKTDNAS